MFRLLSFTLILFITCTAQAQRVIDISSSDANASYSEQLSNFVGGTIFPIDKYIKIKEGTPYYDNEWSTGTLIVGTGTAYQNLQLKLDLLNHEVHYKDADNREMILSVPFKVVILHAGGLDARTFIPGKAWAEADKKLADSWLQVLVNDKVSLLLDLRKKLTETQGYSSATTEQSISDSYVYFVQKSGQMNRVTKWSQLLDLLADKKTEVGRFVRENHLTGDAPLEYTQVVAYYNTL
jgi:hypothetical protein